MTDSNVLGASLRQYFNITEKATRYELRCRKCKAGWALLKPADGVIKPGNVLHLLNHAYSHNIKQDD